MAEQARREKEAQKLKWNLAKSVKWDLVRKKREEYLEIQNKVIAKNKRGNRFMHLMLFMLTMKKIRQNTLSRIKQKVSRMKLVFLINRLKIKFKIKLRRYRPDLKQRSMLRAKHTVNFGTELLLSKTAESRAAQ